ncbi:MAG: hypothetical protein PHD11_09615, partial [Bacteroidales bacterium]|nr:hypothetical protein [Bacteroidales bacterium]
DLATGNDRTKTFLDVKRNCHYKITITKVKSYGYPTEAEALKNPGSNLEYEVVITGDDENFTTSNGQYAVTTDKKDVAILDDVTTAENLVKFICKRHSSQSDASIDTRTVRLVGADKTTLIPATKLQMCKSDGTAIPGNTLTFTVSDETGYQLKFTSPDAASLPDEQVYVEICFGNIRHYVPVNAYVFKVSQPADYTYTGGTKQYEVTSYKTGSPKTGVSWNAEFSSDGGATWSAPLPSWVTAFTTSSTGETTATPYNATIEAQTPSNPHNDRLKAAATLSGINDLSKGGETANCYIVNAPGTYSLPLVYGNARKADGTVDTIAFKPGVWSYGTGNTRLSPFISATGTIPDDGKIAGATNAVLIWQDAKDLVVVDAALSGTYPNQTLTFTVSAANIRQGNAVVAVKESRYNRVLWSWHIWVTDFDPDSPEGDPKSFVNAAGYTYKFMPVNIGWCDGLEYAARNVRVRFTQNESGIQKEMNLNQLVAHKPGNSPYFQWGRKDPFVAGLEGNVNKTWYDSLGVMKVNTPPPYTTAWTGGISGNVIKNGILHPDVYCANTYMDLQYHNLWSARNDISIPIPNDNAVIKSVYDPSPVGYHLPASNAFTGFTTTGTSGTASTINGTWDAVSNSWNLAKSGSDTVNFPCVSYRNRSNSVMLNSGSTGIYWMAVSYTNAGDGSGIINLQYCSQYSSVFSLLSNRITPWGKEYRSYGFSVRPVKD